MKFATKEEQYKAVCKEVEKFVHYTYMGVLYKFTGWDEDRGAAVTLELKTAMHFSGKNLVGHLLDAAGLADRFGMGATKAGKVLLTWEVFGADGGCL